MKVAEQWSHLGGGEIIDTRFADALQHVLDSVADSKCTRSSLPAVIAEDLRNRLTACESRAGNQSSKPVRVATLGLRNPEPYPVLEQRREFLPVAVRIQLTPAGLCDAVDLADMYRNNEADAGVLILPTPAFAERLYPDLPELSRLLGDREQIAKRLPTIPILVLSVDA